MKIKGFSLVELIIVIVLIGTVAAVSGIFLQQGFSSYVTGRPIVAIAGKVNIAVDSLIRELEDADSLTTIEPTRIIFKNQAGTDITFSLSSTTLSRIDGSGAQTLCTNVSSLTIAYFDAAFATTATPANVRFVSVAITVTDSGNPYSLVAGTVIRTKL